MKDIATRQYNKQDHKQDHTEDHKHIQKSVNHTQEATTRPLEHSIPSQLGTFLIFQTFRYSIDISKITRVIRHQTRTYSTTQKIIY